MSIAADRTQGNLNNCTYCGGFLELKEGTDPDVAAKERQWSEWFECEECGKTGRYEVDERNGIEERFFGACQGEVPRL